MPAIGVSRVFNLVGGARSSGAAPGWKRLGHLEKNLLDFKHTSFQGHDNPALKLVVDRQARGRMWCPLMRAA
jgi:hypothetical protein